MEHYTFGFGAFSEPPGSVSSSPGFAQFEPTRFKKKKDPSLRIRAMVNHATKNKYMDETAETKIVLSNLKTHISSIIGSRSVIRSRSATPVSCVRSLKPKRHLTAVRHSAKPKKSILFCHVV